MVPMKSVSRFVSLSSGFKMPTLGLGTYQMSGDAVCQAVDCALSVGYKHIDTAHSYRNGADIGDMIKSRIRSGRTSRKDIFLTSKIPSRCFAPGNVRETALEILDDLQTKYVDMLLLHYPWGKKMSEQSGDIELINFNLTDAWKALENLVKEGFVRSIGLSNFSPRLMDRILSHSKIKASNLQSECHIYHQQNVLREYCLQKGIVFTAYSPLGIPSGHATKPKTELTRVLDHHIIKNIAVELQRTPAQILLRFLLQNNAIPIPKSQTPERIEENLGIFDFELPQNSVDSIRKLDCNVRFYTFSWAEHHPEFVVDECF